MNRIRIHVLPSSRGRLTPAPRVQESLGCSFSQRPCSQPRLEGLEYCLKHVLEDKNSPYRQCGYVSGKNGRRCPSAAPRPDKKDGVVFCSEHARRNALAARAPSKRPPAGPSPEALLAQLSTYLKGEPGGQGGPESSRSQASRILDEESWSEGEGEPVVLDQTWKGEPDSEADSIDSDQEDPLKHAGVYTAEEVALVMREKLIRLQSLYIDQFKRLQHLLQERRRHYLHCQPLTPHAAAGGGCSPVLGGGDSLSTKERVDVRKLRALRRYRKRFGAEALLHRQLKERRALASEGGAAQQQQSQSSARASQRCGALIEGLRCNSPSLPLSRHCLAHVCQDAGQLLFRPCRGLKEAACTKPVPLSQAEDPHCPLHLPVPPPTYRPQPPPAPSPALAHSCPSSRPLPSTHPPHLYLSTAELQPSEILPLEFSQDCLDVVGDESLHSPPSPLFDPNPGAGGVPSTDGSDGPPPLSLHTAPSSSGCRTRGTRDHNGTGDHS